MTAVAGLWTELLVYHRDLGEQDIRPSKAAREGREFIAEHIGPKDRLCLVAASDGEVVGFLVATLRKRSPAFGGWAYGHIYDAYVQAQRRGEGIGALLGGEALRWFRMRGVRRVQLQVRTRNTAGIEFWKRLGFDDLAMTLERRLGRNSPRHLRR